MKREIRFRAWDGARMYIFDNHQFDLIFNDISGWNISPNTPNYKGNWTAGQSSNSEIFELMQFTGCIDKNRKEIYEGDIIKYQNAIYRVEFKYEQWYGIVVNKTSRCDKPLRELLCFSFHVIGNTHQNCDLLATL